MKLKAFLIMAGLWMGLFGLTACGGADVRTYQYPETAVLFDDLHIKKTIYLLIRSSSPGMPLCSSLEFVRMPSSHETFLALRLARTAFS